MGNEKVRDTVTNIFGASNTGKNYFQNKHKQEMEREREKDD